jgi:hypothetical protein
MLDVWERGREASLTERALLLLEQACAETTRDTLAALPVGRRDARLLTLREWAFGHTLSGVTRCPACGERLDLIFTTDAVRVVEPPPPDAPLSVEVDGYEVVFRLPDSTDLASLATNGVVARPEARKHLLERCVRGARRNGRKRALAQLPPRVVDAVVRRMGEADPQADVHTTVACPSCPHSWQAVFDVVSYFWSELESWVHRTLRDVHALASAYGWREAEVLALSPWRRQCYLQLVQR